MSAERLTRPRHGTIADQMVEVLKASGVRRIHGLPGDSLNGLTDALRRDGEIAWRHVPPPDGVVVMPYGPSPRGAGRRAPCRPSGSRRP